MSAPSGMIPYEKQADPQTGRMCGAACLSMVYRSFGKEVPQAEIWQAIAKQNGRQFGLHYPSNGKGRLEPGLVAVAVVAGTHYKPYGCAMRVESGRF